MRVKDPLAAILPRFSNEGVSPVPLGQKMSGLFGRLTASRTSQEYLLNSMGANGTLFGVVDLISTSISQACWHLYRKRAPGSDPNAPRVEVFNHLALQVWNNPNAHSSRQFFVQTAQQHKELVGEMWIVIAHNAVGWPQYMYVVRPDKMEPVPDRTTGVIAGYVYHGPDGEDVPLDLNQVIYVRSPNPLAPEPCGRGMGPVQTVLSDIDSARYSAEWNKNFFLNSAAPGGVVKVPTSLDDRSFDRLRMQWSEQHRGVQNVARVAILENGAEWQDASYSQKDMQFAELRNVSRDVIREAWRVHPHMMGQSDDVNLANAQAADYTFAQWTEKSRLEIWKGVLNSKFLPQFGPFGHGTGQPDVEFDYDSPVPEDQEAANAERASKTSAFKTLIDAGVDPEDAAKTAGLPPMKMKPVVLPNKEQPAPEPAPNGGGDGSTEPAQPDTGGE